MGFVITPFISEKVEAQVDKLRIKLMICGLINCQVI